MGLSRELEQLKRRANRAALSTRLPEIQIYVFNEGDPFPEVDTDWSILIRIEQKRDYYGNGDSSLHPGAEPIQVEDA